MNVFIRAMLRIINILLLIILEESSKEINDVYNDLCYIHTYAKFSWFA
jgi:hypothetical protein